MISDQILIGFIRIDFRGICDQPSVPDCSPPPLAALENLPGAVAEYGDGLRTQSTHCIAGF